MKGGIYVGEENEGRGGRRNWTRGETREVSVSYVFLKRYEYPIPIFFFIFSFFTTSKFGKCKYLMSKKQK
jgi:hypothetical protein